jgi:enamine deaminase RidA (YjgF/YER057c/UK114 family)
VENPRQTPSWRYSQRYGPTPPRFSRATVAALENEPVVLLGGTASIVGEDTVHVGDLERQTHETLRNLAALIAAASIREDESGALDRLRSLRVYVTAPQHADEVRDVLASRCPHLSDVEFATSALCRPELLVEIEGVAALTPRA